MKKFLSLSLVVLVIISGNDAQAFNFKIRTITAGISLSSLSDTTEIIKTIAFLRRSKAEYVKLGYEVSTLRIITQNLYEYLGGKSYSEALPFLKAIDKILKREEISMSVGMLLPANQYNADIAAWAADLVRTTDKILFNIPISLTGTGVYPNSIKVAAEIAVAVSKVGEGGEGNFRFTASANCPAEIPFFPAAWHKGPRSFGIGMETPNILKDVFSKSDWSTARANLKTALENVYKPVEATAQKIATSEQWVYNGIDTSPAPGLDASIGEAIETLTHQPFGGPGTLRACALITDVIKSVDIKTCGYSGLMLPVIEDVTLANRSREDRFTMQELLLFSSVSGTGLDVVPIPGDTKQEAVERIYFDVAALSLKYTNKALSARLFLIPNKKPGDVVEFKNKSLTASVVMKVE